MKERRKKVLKSAAILLACGFLYAGLCLWAGRGLIPCPLHALTGLKCPGCGVTELCLCLLRLDLKGAFRANPALFVLLLPGGAALLYWVIRYVKKGIWAVPKPVNVLLWCLCGLLVLFGMLRNIPGILF